MAEYHIIQIPNEKLNTTYTYQQINNLYKKFDSNNTLEHKINRSSIYS